MITLETSITIGADAQTVWSVLDSLPTYPEWNPIVPELLGQTILGSPLKGILEIPNMPTPPLTPTVSKVVACREFRWITLVNDEDGELAFSAEHVFILKPQGDKTLFLHNEIFDGPATAEMSEPVFNLVKPAYENFNEVFKARVEAFASDNLSLHPRLEDQGDIDAGQELVLSCNCKENPVELEITDSIQHNHLCGCSKCWKPDGAIFALTAVVPKGAAIYRSNKDKLKVVDEKTSIKRHACSSCGVHMLGEVEDKSHHFYGLTFIHPEQLKSKFIPKVEFAGFVSSIVESGFSPSRMSAVRREIGRRQIPSYDVFSPEIMDVISYHQLKLTFKPIE